MKSRRNEISEPQKRLKGTKILCGLCGIFAAFAVAGCGYTSSAILPNDVKTIHVETFRNDIDITKEVSAKDKYDVYRPNLEVDLRDKIIERIFLDGYLKVKTHDLADAILEGEVIQYRKDPLRYQNLDVEEYRLSLVSNVRLKRTRDSEILLEEKNITGDSTYFTTGPLQKSEAEALNDTMQDLARRIVNRIVENW